MNVLRIPISQATPGMLAADDIYTFNDQLIIAKGTKLTDRIITRLNFYTVNDLNIIVEKSTPQSSKQTKKQLSHYEFIKESFEFKQFNQKFVESVDAFKGDFDNIDGNDASLDLSRLLEHTTSILSKSRNGIHVFDMLHCMREYDDLTYVHSINVALICNVFGNWLNLPQDDIDILTLCGLLHDIGKLKLPTGLLGKKDALTDSEFSTIKTHSIRGYQILKNKAIDPRIKYTALMHHERCDGSGYPNGYHSAHIDSFAKIVAIADVYDAMTSARVYRPALSPFEAISIFETEGLQKYDPHYLITFLEGIVQSYVGHRVRLNNRLEGEIIMINKPALSRPVVQIGSHFLDLSKEHNIVIQAIL